jgi:hypothetical protein
MLQMKFSNIFFILLQKVCNYAAGNVVTYPTPPVQLW